VAAGGGDGSDLDSALLSDDEGGVESEAEAPDSEALSDIPDCAEDEELGVGAEECCEEGADDSSGIC